jgi:hypothetical protein
LLSLYRVIIIKIVLIDFDYRLLLKLLVASIMARTNASKPKLVDCYKVAAKALVVSELGIENPNWLNMAGALVPS